MPWVDALLPPVESEDEATVDASSRRHAAWAVLALGLATWFASLAIAVLLPSFYGVDEPAHLGYVSTLLDGKLPRIDEPLPRDQFEVLDKLMRRYDKHGGGPNGRDTVWVANHPPGYYAVAAPFAWLGERMFGANGALLGLRLVSATSIALCTVAVGALAGRLVPRRSDVAVGAAALFALTAQIPHTGAIAYSDPAAILMWVVALCAAVEVLRRPTERLTPLLVLGTAAIAAATALTRASVLPAVAAIVGAWIAAAVLAARAGHSPRRAIEGAVAAVLAPALLAGPWYLRNRHLYGSMTADHYLLNRFGRDADPGALHRLFRLSFWHRAANGTFGGIRGGASLAIAVPIVTVIAVVALVLGVVAARGLRLRVIPVRGALAWAAVVCASLILVYGVGQFLREGGFFHARYLIPLVPIAAVAVSAGLTSRRGRPWLLAAALVTMATMQAVMVWRMIRLLPHHTAGILVPVQGWGEATAYCCYGLYLAALMTAAFVFGSTYAQART